MNHIPYIGGKITEPGIYARVNMSAYHRADICDGPSVSSSGLRTVIRKSLKHFWATSALNPQRHDSHDEDKRHFIMGRAVHHLVLGEPFFTKLFVEQPDQYEGVDAKKKPTWKPWNNNAQKCQDWNAEQRRLGRTPLKPDEVERVRGMMLALGREPLIRQGILNGAIERSLFWKDKESGIWLKARPDTIPNDSDDIVDLKATRSTDWLDCQSAIGVGRGGYGYIQQGALVAEGWRQIFGREINSFTLVFIEHEYPHDIRVMEIEKEDLKRGHDLNRLALNMIWRGLKNQEWPGRAGVQHDAQSLGLSDRERERVDAIIKHGSIN